MSLIIFEVFYELLLCHPSELLSCMPFCNDFYRFILRDIQMG